MPWKRRWWAAIAARSSGMPGPGGYWLTPARIASTAASRTSGGPSVSGNPWPRLIAPVRAASADISAKIVVPKPARREVSAGRSTRRRTLRRGREAGVELVADAALDVLERAVELALHAVDLAVERAVE